MVQNAQRDALERLWLLPSLVAGVWPFPESVVEGASRF
eukprot:SAG31_NODE_43090_length_268_cov_1.218935_1_plen_37_part_01